MFEGKSDEEIDKLAQEVLKSAREKLNRIEDNRNKIIDEKIKETINNDPINDRISYENQKENQKEDQKEDQKEEEPLIKKRKIEKQSETAEKLQASADTPVNRVNAEVSTSSALENFIEKDSASSLQEKQASEHPIESSSPSIRENNVWKKIRNNSMFEGKSDEEIDKLAQEVLKSAREKLDRIEENRNKIIDEKIKETINNHSINDRISCENPTENPTEDLNEDQKERYAEKLNESNQRNWKIRENEEENTNIGRALESIANGTLSDIQREEQDQDGQIVDQLIDHAVLGDEHIRMLVKTGWNTQRRNRILKAVRDTLDEYQRIGQDIDIDYAMSTITSTLRMVYSRINQLS